MPHSSLLLILLLSACGSVRSDFALPQVQAIYQDPVGQLYEQYSNGRLHKRDVPADTTYVFFDNLLGNIDWVDAANPFRTILYFEDFQTIIFVDRTLSEIARLDLRNNTEIEQAGPVARGLDDQIWVFDNAAFRLRLLDEQGRQRLESDDLRRSLGINSPPANLFARRSWVVAWWPERGLARFSNVGQFLAWVELPPADGYSWQGQGLSGWQLDEAGKVEEQWYWDGQNVRTVSCVGDIIQPRGIIVEGEACRTW